MKKDIHHCILPGVFLCGLSHFPQPETEIYQNAY